MPVYGLFKVYLFFTFIKLVYQKTHCFTTMEKANKHTK